MAAEGPRLQMAAMLRFPRALALAVALAVLLATPTLFAPLYADDIVFVGRLEGSIPAVRPGIFALYTFADPAFAESPVKDAIWWAVPEVKLSFFRPLASALFAADHALAGRAAWPYHVHTLVWFLGSSFGAGYSLASLMLQKR